MKLHYAGKYDLDESKLPQREHPANSVPFKEPDHKKFAIIANGGAIVLLLILIAVVFKVGMPYFKTGSSVFFIGALLSCVVLFPHEVLHASCFKGDVWLYTNLSRGMLFVVGPEDMSKGRFIFMSLLPNIVFGLIPLIIFFIFPNLIILGVFGAFSLSMGFGDYINVFNALTQMPKGSKTYLSGFHSYWYKPE